MILSKRRDRRIEGVIESLALLRSNKGIHLISKEFQNQDDKRQIENRVNRAFLSCLKEVFRKYNIQCLQELPIQPQTDKPYHSSEEKKPDISLVLNDDLNEDFIFNIECKRLGSPTSSSWQYNEKYVENGIYRFTTSEYCYGIDSNSGAMIGYIEDMKFETILTEVNQAIDNQLGINKLANQSIQWKEKSSTHLSIPM